MELSKEVWVVSEYGGEYEDKWEHVIGVFPTESLAKEFVEWHKGDKIKNIIPPEKYRELLEELDKIADIDEYYEYDDNYWINKLHPEYSIEVLDKSEFYYSNYYTSFNYWIEKIPYYGK